MAPSGPYKLQKTPPSSSLQGSLVPPASEIAPRWPGGGGKAPEVVPRWLARPVLLTCSPPKRPE